MMKKIVAILSIVTFAFSSSNFVEELKKSLDGELAKENQRLQEFRLDVNTQKAKLQALKNEFKKQKALQDELMQKQKSNELLLKEKEKELAQKSGDLGNILNSIRQTSTKVYNSTKHSYIVVKDPQNLQLFLDTINLKNLNLQSIKEFWLALADEIVKSGYVSEFKAPVIGEGGIKKDQTINTLGKFAAFSENKYLGLSDDLNSFVVLSTQPNAWKIGDIDDFGTKNVSSVLVDVTGGSLFELLEHEPTILDKVKQGGIVGYIIIFLGALGLLYSFLKIIVLQVRYKKIQKQLKDLSTPKDNPLGKIIEVFEKYKDKPISEIEAKIGEEMLTQTNTIQSGKDFVKLLATITPLLGLLGTVTGMITTFEVITMFGTGDPKLMAGGISSALVTTVLGLVTAIPLLFAYSYLNSKVHVILAILEEQSIGLLAKSFGDD